MAFQAMVNRMNIKKHALALFTKSPQPGATKTRLTEKYGGSLTEQ